MKKPKYRNGTTLWNVLVLGGKVSLNRMEILDVQLVSFLGETEYEYSVRISSDFLNTSSHMGILCNQLDLEPGFDNVYREIVPGCDHAFTSERRARRFMQRAMNEQA